MHTCSDAPVECSTGTCFQTMTETKKIQSLVLVPKKCLFPRPITCPQRYACLKSGWRSPQEPYTRVYNYAHLQRLAIYFFRGSSQPKYQTQVSCTAGRFFTAKSPEKPLLEVAWGPTPPSTPQFSQCKKAAGGSDSRWHPLSSLLGI